MNRKVIHLAWLVFAAALQGCNGVPIQVNLIESVEQEVGQSPALNLQLLFKVNGVGKCSRIEMDWGDGVKENIFPGLVGDWDCSTYTDASGQARFQCTVTHVFTGWGGGKTVTAIAKEGCEGRVHTRFKVAPLSYGLAMARPGPNVCGAIPNRPALADRTWVRITTVPTKTRCGGIFYRDVTPHCYDAEGGAVAQASPTTDPAPVFPFLGMRMYSLVLRVGTQLVQGGTNMSFITNKAAPLEICVNEPDARLGVGGYGIDITTDQLGPAPP